jgi:lantibiotic biosynthesis protein
MNKETLKRVNALILGSAIPTDGLFNGRLGVIYYCYQLYLLTNEKRYWESAEQLLLDLIADINNGKSDLLSATLSSGKAGMAYVLNILLKDGVIDEIVNKMLSSLDIELYESAKDLIEQDNLDFLHGAGGIIYYFINRMETKDVRTYLNNLVEIVCLQAQPHGNGIWFKNVFNGYNNDTINLSYSHGLSGLLALLCNSHKYYNNQEQLENVIRKGISYILSTYKESTGSLFPSTINPNTNEPKFIKRLAWCYGDLNQSLLLQKAGKLLKIDNWIRLSDVITSQTLLRNDEATTMISDSQFCHGSAGLATIYTQLHNTTGMACYRVASSYWTDYTANSLEIELKERTGAYLQPHSILEGLAGVSLSLLSLEKNQFNWLDLFLL